jgi:hypothetical protein
MAVDKFLVIHHAVVTEISACSANCAKYLQGDVLILLQFHHDFPQLAQHPV